jgi:hypothetical protein
VPPDILEDTPVDSDKEETDSDQDFQCDPCSTAPQCFSQSDLNDLVRDLGLPKDSAEVLGSRLKSNNLLSHGTGTDKKSVFHISLKMGRRVLQ